MFNAFFDNLSDDSTRDTDGEGTLLEKLITKEESIMEVSSLFKDIKSDLSASIVVFFVAVPLCLGIALASGAPLFAGIIAGIIGGIVVGIVSGSPLGVSGPGAGLAVIVMTSIETIGSWSAFLLSVVLAGILQLFLGFAKAGFIGFFFPSSVINGMLTGIGALIIFKQIPYALGFDSEAQVDLSYFQSDGQVTLSSITDALSAISPGILIISGLSLALLVLWDAVLTKKHKLFRLLQGPIVVVFTGILMTYFYQYVLTNFSLADNHLVRLPVANSITEFFSFFTFPDFSAITQFEVWKAAVVIGIVASLETLLSVEAADKLDPYNRVTPTNRELVAQGVGNTISGLIGGLPITQVIVRSSANIAFGAKTKLSAILHGVFLLISAITVAGLLNMIPLASLAAILMMVGYKLVKPSLFKKMYQLGSEQFVPFIATIIGILATDLLNGIAFGMLFGIFYTLQASYRNAYSIKEAITTEGGHELHRLVLAEDVTFFNKASILKALETIPDNSNVIIDCSNTKSLDYDVSEVIKNYRHSAQLKNITVETIKFIEPA